jgi:hypothetical protein
MPTLRLYDSQELSGLGISLIKNAKWGVLTVLFFKSIPLSILLGTVLKV